ncbi:hypothetical protein Mgra_00009013 [Meloidogyne graminicola]|uniref:Uncharacterized protein n=1 Tax=Meloidogyne graminicola TaxID=189291 RepID=A0A8S9ZE36_9BILA|nr:hypothetical protein Mgra_00009013 [Meloidogyne graminicola]
MNHLCCCSSCKPRYQRIVDNIYPRIPPYDVPISGNMQKLTFYSIFHPEKLNRIGIYLVQRLSRDLGRQKVADVKVAVDAIDQLLKSCHGSPSINQFIESFLLMVQRLLDTNDPQMEKLATDLFVGFSAIEEDSPSYHRQYDFFISKFSSMCHANRGDYIRSQRFNGLRGLRGVIWKSASDDLQANIWEKQHMNKIIPSILFNFQDENDEVDDQHVDHTTAMLFHHYPEEQNGSIAETEPRNLALQCLRELFQKCSFGSLKSVLEPVFRHFDLHNKWDHPAQFAIKTFIAILYSIQSQNSYFVIQELINQLEQVQHGESNVRVGMATVLSNIVSIAGTSIGPLLLAIFNSLLKLLLSSVEFQQSKQCVDLGKEQLFQNTLLNALHDFVNILPDYQKIEIIKFISCKIQNIEVAELTGEAFLHKLFVKILGDGYDMMSNYLSQMKIDEPKLLNKRTSHDSISVDSSSMDSGLYDTATKTTEDLNLPITAETLRNFANTPLNFDEEERLDQEKSRKVLKMFRDKNQQQLSELFKHYQRHCSCFSTGPPCPQGNGEGQEETLAQTIQRLTIRHDEKTRIRMFGQQAPPATIFDIKFPSFEI